jgi:hypothetical protein
MLFSIDTTTGVCDKKMMNTTNADIVIFLSIDYNPCDFKFHILHNIGDINKILII